MEYIEGYMPDQVEKFLSMEQTEITLKGLAKFHAYFNGKTVPFHLFSKFTFLGPTYKKEWPRFQKRAKIWNMAISDEMQQVGEILSDTTVFFVYPKRP
eukprot:UN16766